MGRITTGIGLVSGINSKEIIDQLMQLESRPKTVIQSRLDKTNSQKLAYTDLVTRLTALRLSAVTFKKPQTFRNAAAASSDEDVLTATTRPGATTGTFQFQVARLVSSQQTISNGLADPDATRLGAGTLTLEQGGGELYSPIPLSQLNGGDGVRRGAFRITDRSGHSAVIDISTAVSLQDVVRKINTSLDIMVRASIGREGLELTDLSGQAASNFIVQDLGDGHAAADLGLLANAASGTITGGDINSLGRNTLLSQLNDGRGVRTATGLPDFSITGTGGTYNVSLTGATTLGAVVDAINTATGNAVRAEIVAGSNGLRLTDSGGAAITVAALNGSAAAADLGIAGTAAGTLNGSAVIASLNTVLVGSLRGGTGLNLGQISITDRSGATATVDLSSAGTVQDILDAISDAAGVSVTASLKASGNGIQITDDSGGTGNLVIADSTSTTAAELGIAGTFAPSQTAVAGTNLQRQWVSANTLLGVLNSGKGVTAGKFKITDSAGRSAEVDLTQGNELTVGDVLQEINSRGIGVTASINANGDGLLLTDTAGGAGRLKVEEAGGTTAADLNIKGAATATTIDGSYERTLEVTATDTLNTLVAKINQAGLGVSASLINDGSGAAPFRLSLASRSSGYAGRVVLDAGATSLQLTNLVEAQDAAVFIGSSQAARPLLVTSASNQLANVISGVSIDLHNVSEKPVTLSISRDGSNVAAELQKFTDNFNQMVQKLRDLTDFDPETKKRGLLLGEAAAQQVETQVYAMLQAVVPGGGRYRILADIGLKIGQDSKLTFDQEKFTAAFADSPDDVMELFSGLQAAAAGTKLSDLRGGRGIAPGSIRITNSAGQLATVDLSAATTLGQVMDAINAAGLSVSATLKTDGTGLVLTDTAGGAGKLIVTDFGSTTAAELGIRSASASRTITATLSLAASSAGSTIESRINKLIDPVSGVLTLENRTLDERARQFQTRMADLDKLLEAKRARLERQFASLESVLAKLQSQQASLGQLSSLATMSSNPGA